MVSELMQPIISQHDIFVDMAIGPLVNGKVEIYDPVSNNLLNVYTYTDDEYAVAANPVILSVEGRPEQTIFSDRLSYLRVYAYDGLDEHNNPMYHFVRDYYAGHNAQSEVTNNVIGIEALKDVDPAYNTQVTVVGYHNQFDCEPRLYIWDPNSTLDADNGYVVASDVSDTGRWLLQFDGEYIPSSYYGVYPGQESNINALASYIGEIHGKATAPGIWFVPGDYDLDTNFNTEKKVLLDSNTTFSCQYFYCGNLTVKDTPNTAICDFVFHDASQEAHSSWFNTVAGFLTSGAKKFIFDQKDNFVNHTLQNTTYTLQDKIIEGQTRLPVTYSGASSKIILNHCAINAVGIFNSTDQLIFFYTDIHDNWWTNPAEIDFNSKVSARSHSLNQIILGNFTNVNAYVNAKVADGFTFVDLAGREIASLSFTGGLIELRNAYVTEDLNISKQGVDIYLKHVKCGNVYCSCRYLHIEDNSNITFRSEPSFSAMWAYDSKIYGSSPWTGHNKQIVCKNCEVGFGLNWAQDNDFDHSVVEFIECTFQENNYYYVKRLTMKRCVTDNNTIKIYPHKVDNIYYLGQVTLESNTFNNSNPVEFTKVDVIDGWAQDNVYECRAQWNITNNLFLGNNEGLRCRYWQHRIGGSNYNKGFIADSQDNTIVYEGNVGNCPADSARGMGIAVNTAYTKTSLYIGSEYVDIYKYSSSPARIMPVKGIANWPRGYFEYPTKELGTLMKYYSWVNSPYNSLTDDMFIHPTWWLYHVEEDEPIYDGDFFSMGIMLWGDYLRIVQRGDGDRNQGVVGKVI